MPPLTQLATPLRTSDIPFLRFIFLRNIFYYIPAVRGRSVCDFLGGLLSTWSRILCLEKEEKVVSYLFVFILRLNRKHQGLNRNKEMNSNYCTEKPYDSFVRLTMIQKFLQDPTNI